MNTTKILGELEIDHERGVIYFHCISEDLVEKYGTVSILRIQGLSPIPKNKSIDISTSGEQLRVCYGD